MAGMSEYGAAKEWQVGIMQCFVVLIFMMVAGSECDGLSLPCPTGCTCYPDIRRVRCTEQSVVPSGFPRDTVEIYMHNNQLKELPENAFQNVSNLKLLFLYSNQIKELPATIFGYLTKLTHLYLYKNQLEELPDDIFQNLTNLRYLNMNRNQLEELPGNIFRYMKQLTYLNVHSNRIQNLSGLLLQQNTALRYLYLYGNQLKELPENIFRDLTKLTHLYLNNNQLRDLPDDIFQNLPNLSILHLYTNQLKELPENIFGDLRMLTSLYLNNNHLKDLPADIFQSLTNMRYLDVFNNPLKLGNGLCPLAYQVQKGLTSFNSDAVVENYTKMMIANCSGAVITCYAVGSHTMYFCKCPSGQLYNGSRCANLTSCPAADTSQPCHNYPQCQYTNHTYPGFRCQCSGEFQLAPSGHLCIDYCSLRSSPRIGGWTCSNGNGTSTVYCTEPGYYTTGGHCVNANECADVAQSSCQGNTACVDTMGSFKCECKTGFTGNETLCTDVDECDVTAASKCPSNSMCRNVLGSFTCDCENGFTANTVLTDYLEYNQSCDNVNECLSNVQNICKENSTCTDTYGSYKCVCRSGYQAGQQNDQAEACININECNSAVSASACKEDFTCIDTPGSFVCVPNSEMETTSPQSSPSAFAMLAVGTTALLLGGVMTVAVLLMKRKVRTLTFTASSPQPCDTMELRQGRVSVVDNTFTDNEAYGIESSVDVNNEPVHPSSLTDPDYLSVL